jgi:hypothetical protein
MRKRSTHEPAKRKHRTVAVLQKIAALRVSDFGRQLRLNAETREGNMLKITITQTPALMRWVLQGRLVEPWVSELRTNWKKAYRSRKVCTCVIDLNDVISVDRAGEKLLRAMSREGVQFIAGGLYIRHVLEALEMSGKPKPAG